MFCHKRVIRSKRKCMKTSGTRCTYLALPAGVIPILLLKEVQAFWFLQAFFKNSSKRDKLKQPLTGRCLRLKWNGLKHYATTLPRIKILISQWNRLPSVVIVTEWITFNVHYFFIIWRVNRSESIALTDKGIGMWKVLRCSSVIS